MDNKDVKLRIDLSLADLENYDFKFPFDAKKDELITVLSEESGIHSPLFEMNVRNSEDLLSEFIFKGKNGNHLTRKDFYLSLSDDKDIHKYNAICIFIENLKKNHAEGKDVSWKDYIVIIEDVVYFVLEMNNEIYVAITYRDGVLKVPIKEKNDFNIDCLDTFRRVFPK